MQVEDGLREWLLKYITNLITSFSKYNLLQKKSRTFSNRSFTTLQIFEFKEMRYPRGFPTASGYRFYNKGSEVLTGISNIKGTYIIVKSNWFI